MIIYASSLVVHANDVRGPLHREITNWLSAKVRQTLEPASLVDGYHGEFPPNSLVEVAAAEANSDYPGGLIGYRLQHGDAATSGRTWTTDIGVMSTGQNARVSLVLSTHEDSRLVSPVLETTRPRIVTMIADSCRINSSTVGGSPMNLTLEDADAFDYRLRDPERDFPIVVVSCDRGGRYIVDATRLASLLLGIAEVVAIPPGIDTFRLEDLLTPSYSAYGGAVCMIWPRSRFGDRDLIPSQKLMTERLVTMLGKPGSVESEILAMVCHRTNPKHDRDAVTVVDVRRISAQQQLSRAKAVGTADSEEMRGLYEAIDIKQRQQISELEETLERTQSEVEQLRDQKDELERTCDALKLHLGAAQAPQRPQEVDSQLDHALIHRAIIDEPCLEDCLKVIEMCFPNRVEILTSAWSSARDSVTFKHGRKALGLLWTLCDEFWRCLADGQGT